MSIPPDMPLDGSGRMTCITCHSFHYGDILTNGEKTFLLRREKGKMFCYTCHKKL
jgi:predicted CXXCH cytochrome family protein